MPVVLGLGLLLRDFKRVLEYEEDEASPDSTPSYIPGSMMNLEFSITVNAAIQEVFQQITGLIDRARQAHLIGVDENEEDVQMKVVEGEVEEEEEEGGNGEKEAGMRDMQMQEGEDEDEDEVDEVNSGKES